MVVEPVAVQVPSDTVTVTVLLEAGCVHWKVAGDEVAPEMEPVGALQRMV
jgi:hypothetical protein